MLKSSWYWASPKWALSSSIPCQYHEFTYQALPRFCFNWNLNVTLRHFIRHHWVFKTQNWPCKTIFHQVTTFLVYRSWQDMGPVIPIVLMYFDIMRMLVMSKEMPKIHQNGFSNGNQSWKMKIICSLVRLVGMSIRASLQDFLKWTQIYSKPRIKFGPAEKLDR